MSSVKIKRSPLEESIATAGTHICVLGGGIDDIENWMKDFKDETSGEFDYHFSSGLANVFYVADPDSECSEEQLKNIIKKLSQKHKLKLIELYGEKLP